MVLRRWWLRTALGFAVCLVMLQSALGQAPLVFLGDRNLPPYEFLENGQPRGANVELALAVGRMLGRPTEVRLIDWSKAPEMLLSGQADALTLLGRTAEREKQFLFSAPTVPVSFALFVRADEAAQFASTSLAGRRIGVTAGGLARSQMQALYPEVTPVLVDTVVHGMQMVLRRELDGLAAQDWSAYYILGELGIRAITGLTPFRIGEGNFAVRPTDAALAAQFDGALAQLRTSGEYDRIIERWSYTRVRLVQESTVTALTVAASIALAALIALSVALAVLQRKRAALGREVVQRRRAEEALLKSQQQLLDEDRRKDEFLATLAHELRGPLAPISNASRVLQLGSGNPDKVAWAHDVIARQAGQMARLVDDLLDVSRIKVGKLELRRHPLELASLLADSLEAAGPVIAQCQHRVRQSASPAPVWLDGDRARLAQVFANLLTNAAKYMEPGGSITVEAAVRDGMAEIVIGDDGVGIQADRLDKVFEMFHQEGSSLGQSQGGLGVGLWLSRQLVLLHEGTIVAHSDGPGKGSRFIVRLPLADAPAPAVVPAVNGTGRLRVLVVDDNLDGAETLAMLLEALGHQTRVAGDGAQALREGAAFAPQVVLLDIGLPDVDGHEVCRRMRATDWGGSALVVALTGWGGEADKRAARDAGFDAHLTKPAQAADLERLLRQESIRPGGVESET